MGDPLNPLNSSTIIPLNKSSVYLKNRSWEQLNDVKSLCLVKVYVPVKYGFVYILGFSKGSPKIPTNWIKYFNKKTLSKIPRP